MEGYIQTLGDHVNKSATFYANGQRIIVVHSNMRKSFLEYHMHKLAINYDVLH